MDGNPVSHIGSDNRMWRQQKKIKEKKAKWKSSEDTGSKINSKIKPTVNPRCCY